MENADKKLAELEALLFIHGEPLAHRKVETVLGIEKGECASLIEALKKNLEGEDRGLQLLSDKEKVQLATKPAFNKILEAFMKEELTEELTPASLETLSIIAYLGPISRAKIEYLRGVNSSMILRSLAMRGLVERMTDQEHASLFLYRPTFEVMRHLGMQKQEDLPEFEKFRELLTVFNAPGEEIKNENVVS